jgi:hypothetical protein
LSSSSYHSGWNKKWITRAPRRAELQLLKRV